ncbi:MAG: hypothetical protein L7F78_22835, partial [Syntrophales bacterium LBB04]|nr:hypothetical protein [Syntrophales bacterium LBB04]
MEKKLLKKDKLSGIVKKMAADKTLYAPVQDEDNVLFKVLGPGMEPLVAFANTKNAPKKVFFPHSELLVKYTRSPKGMVFAAMPADAKEFVLFGVRPCDARSFSLLDMLFDQDKWKDPYYIEKRKKSTVISIACVQPPLRCAAGEEPDDRSEEGARRHDSLRGLLQPLQVRPAPHGEGQSAQGGDGVDHRRQVHRRDLHPEPHRHHRQRHRPRC